MITAAQNARNAGTTIAAIGVGSLTNVDTLNLIARYCAI